MKRTLAVLLGLATFRANVAHAGEIRSQVGLLSYADMVPLPAYTGVWDKFFGIKPRGTGGFLLAAGALELGLEYSLGNFGNVSAYATADTGLNFDLTKSALYYSAGIGTKVSSFVIQAAAVRYYRTEYEHTREDRDRTTGLLKLMYEITDN